VDVSARQRGYSLAELLFVVAILALVVAMASPTSSRPGAARIERAGREVADTLEFARREALRTGVPHGVRVTAPGRVAVFRLDRSVVPPLERYDVRHPVDKALYDTNLQTAPFAENTGAIGWFLFQGGASADAAVAFDARGEPIRPADRRPLATGGIVLANEGYGLAVAVAPLTGRVRAGAVTATIAIPSGAFPTPVQP
jgi:prepilin-type N-terminal cleavage/methylation domain-containing protein